MKEQHVDYIEQFDNENELKLKESEKHELKEINERKKESSYWNNHGKYKKKDKLKSTWRF